MKVLFQLCPEVYTFVACVLLDEKIISESNCQVKLKDVGVEETTGARGPDGTGIEFSCLHESLSLLLKSDWGLNMYLMCAIHEVLCCKGGCGDKNDILLPIPMGSAVSILQAREDL